MSFAVLPPEMRVLCRNLTDTKPEQLPSSLPALLQNVRRCQGLFSEPQGTRNHANGSESGVLVYKFRTQIHALLNGRSIEGHFAAVGLIKGIVDAGGFECLRTSEAWVRGLLSILQKRDPVATKDLCVVTLTKIYVMVQKYQTLVREIATPTLPTFASACLQILKSTALGKVAKVPLSFHETVFEALSTLIPLYPTTLRPFVSQIRTAVRPFVAPTSSDGVFVPDALQSSSRRLVARLHMTAAKNGGSDEWAKHFNGLLKESHATADQVFRAVQESWESVSGYSRQHVDFDSELSGGRSSPEQLPPWTGFQAGSERLVSLIKSIADCLRCKTKTPVSVPVSAIIDLSRRISSIMLRTSVKEKPESVQFNAAVGREEKDELYAAFPGIQVAVMELLLVLAQRMGRNYIPLAQDTLDQTLRMFDTCYALPEIRAIAFALSDKMVRLHGSTMSKTNVDGLALLIKSCCRDLQGASGLLKKPKQQAPTKLQNGSKSKPSASNVDAFLSSQANEEPLAVSLDEKHLTAAENLLVTLLSHLPQQHINSSTRALILRTAIECRMKDALTAAVLHPSRDKNGRVPQIVLELLHQEFPHAEIVELLRFNFRTSATIAVDRFEDMDEAMEVEDESAPTNRSAFDKPFEATSTYPLDDVAMQDPAPELPASVAAPTMQPRANAFETREGNIMVTTKDDTDNNTIDNPLKRKSEEIHVPGPKRIEVHTSETSVVHPGFTSVGTLVESSLRREMQAAEESDDESVHLNMDFDGSDDED